MHFELGIEGRKIHFKEGVTTVVLHWREYWGIRDGLVTGGSGGAPAGVCMKGTL